MTLKFKDTYLKFNSDTVENVRKEFNMDKLGAMDQALDILQEWVQKQQHFTKKEFSRRYLETFLIASKGSIERVKSKIDKVCTARTTMPFFFEKCHAINDFSNMRDFFLTFPLPRMLEDDHRIHIFQVRSKIFTPATCLEAMQQCIISAEYLKLHDYVKGYYLVADLNDVTNVMDIITNVNIIEFRDCLDILTVAYGFRLAKIFVISSSTLIKAFIKVIKQILSPKIGERICLLKTPESLYDYFPKTYLPADFGGEQKSILELYDEFIEKVCSKEHVEHMQTMKLFRTIEELRPSTQSHKDSFGVNGSFKTLSID